MGEDEGGRANGVHIKRERVSFVILFVRKRLLNAGPSGFSRPKEKAR